MFSVSVTCCPFKTCACKIRGRKKFSQPRLERKLRFFSFCLFNLIEKSNPILLFIMIILIFIRYRCPAHSQAFAPGKSNLGPFRNWGEVGFIHRPLSWALEGAYADQFLF